MNDTSHMATAWDHQENESKNKNEIPSCIPSPYSWNHASYYLTAFSGLKHAVLDPLKHSHIFCSVTDDFSVEGFVLGTVRDGLTVS